MIDALTTCIDGAIAVRAPDARYIRYPDGAEEFYDRASDPNEWTNLAGKPANHAGAVFACQFRLDPPARRSII